MVPHPFFIKSLFLKFLTSSHDLASNEPLVLKIGSCTWKFSQFFIFGPNAPNKEIECNFYYPHMILHPASSWFKKSDDILESYSQLPIFAPNVPNKEIECHTHFLRNYCFILKFYNPLMILDPRSPWFSKLDQVLES